MNRFIFLDSGPLSLLTHRRGVPAADACKAWLGVQLAKGNYFFVPEVIDSELRRELLRAGKSAAVARLDAFSAATPARYVPLTTTSVRLAAQLGRTFASGGCQQQTRRNWTSMSSSLHKRLTPDFLRKL